MPTLMLHPRPLAMRIKIKEERGSSCLIPWEGMKEGKGESLVRMEKKDNDMSCNTQLTQ
jgi:hypothetical protein